MGLQNLSMGQRAAASDMAARASSKDSTKSPTQYFSTSSDNLRQAATPTLNSTSTAAFMSEDNKSAHTSFLARKMEAMDKFEEECMGDHEGTVQDTFNLFMGAVIVVNVLYIALEMDFGPEPGVAVADRMGWFLASSTFLTLFIVEIAVRIHWERWQWLHMFWNWFDFTVVMCAIIDVWILPLVEGKIGSLQALSILRLARLVRLVRMVKLVRTLKNLYVMMMAFLHALRSMVFLGCIMFFGMLIYAIFATIIIGRNSEFADVRINDDSVDDRFGKVYRSMYSLFELMTLEGWEEVSRPLVEKNPLCFLFIGSFIMIFPYGLLNMVVATVVEKTLEQTNAMKEFDEKVEEKRIGQELINLKSIFEECDTSKNGSLSLEEFQGVLLANEALVSSLISLGMPIRDAKELFDVLDFNSDHELSISEFVDGVGKLREGQPSPWDNMSSLSTVNKIKTDVRQLQGKFKKFVSNNAVWQANMETRSEEQSAMLREVLLCLKQPGGASQPPGSLASQDAPGAPKLPPMAAPCWEPPSPTSPSSEAEWNPAQAPGALVCA